MNQTIKHILSAVLFCAGAALMLFVISVLAAPEKGAVVDGINGIDANGILAEADDSVDLIFLGDSEIYASVIPLEIWNRYGYATYGCTTPSQKLYTSQDILENAFYKQNPKVVMFETSAVFRKFNFDESVIHTVGNYVPAIKYHDRWKYFLKGVFGTRGTPDLENENKGYRMTMIIDPGDDSKYMQPSDNVKEIPERNIEYMKKMVEYCESHGAKFILYSTPSTKNWRFSKHNAIVQLADELGVEYLDMNLYRDQLNINWETDTRDGGDHLNHLGALKVTKFLGEYIDDMGVLTDHRGEEKYAHWDELYKKYKAVERTLFKKVEFSKTAQEVHEEIDGGD